MADLYGSNESEDMSSFLQVLLHNNSSSSAAPTDSTAGSAAVGSFFTGAAAESSSSINFSDNSYFFANDGLDLSSRVDNIGSTFEGSEASDRQAHLAQRNSSKRSRAAEVHNLTEKRRRSRINEKLKALQNLIPNSNKTDKASMLDEAIEYLKQLQLQVQMLTLRNGLSTHPGYSLGQIQAMLVPPAGLEIDEGNTLLSVNRGTDHQFTRNQDVFIQSALETTNPSSSTQPMLQTHMGVGTNNNSGILPSIVPSMQNHYGLLNHLASSKDICREDTLSRLQLDTSCSGNNSSPEVSS